MHPNVSRDCGRQWGATRVHPSKQLLHRGEDVGGEGGCGGWGQGCAGNLCTCPSVLSVAANPELFYQTSCVKSSQPSSRDGSPRGWLTEHVSSPLFSRTFGFTDFFPRIKRSGVKGSRAAKMGWLLLRCHRKWCSELVTHVSSLHFLCFPSRRRADTHFTNTQPLASRPPKLTPRRGAL